MTTYTPLERSILDAITNLHTHDRTVEIVSLHANQETVDGFAAVAGNQFAAPHYRIPVVVDQTINTHRYAFLISPSSRASDPRSEAFRAGEPDPVATATQVQEVAQPVAEPAPHRDGAIISAAMDRFVAGIDRNQINAQFDQFDAVRFAGALAEHLYGLRLAGMSVPDIMALLDRELKSLQNRKSND